MTGRRRALLGLAALALAGCGSSQPSAALRARTGPPGVVRIALAGLRWPLDPALAEGRDQTQLARTLYATPFRVDHAGALRPGLCSRPRSPDLRVWDFTCRHAPAIAAELRRVASLPRAPSRWLFADATRIEAHGADLHVVLARPWRRFPLALTAVAAAPRGVPGPFRVVSASHRSIVAVRPGLRLELTRMEPHAAAVAFRRGLLDEAPVALGDLRAAELDPALRGMVRVRPLLGVDLVAFGSGVPAAVRRVFWQTADRQDYQALVPEYAAAPAYGLIAGAPRLDAVTGVQPARARVAMLPPVFVPISAPGDLAYGANLVAAQWRDLGLGTAVRRGPARATFERVIAPYPAPEALLGQVRSAVTAGDETSLRRADAELQRSAAVVPLAWVAGARLVSSRLRGWRQDALGSVDYAAVRAPASSRRP